MMSFFLLLFNIVSTNSTSCCDWNERLIPVQFKSESNIGIGIFYHRLQPSYYIRLVSRNGYGPNWP